MKKASLFVTGGNVVAAVAIPLVTNIISPTALTGKEQFFLGLAVFMLLNVTELLILASELRESIAAALVKKVRDEKVLEIEDEVDRHVSEVQRLLRLLASGAGNETELFFEYHKRKLYDLERSLRDACVKREVQINDTMISVTEWLLESSFRGRNSDVLRAVLPTTGISFFFDVHTSMYFRRMYELVSSRRASEVRRLIVIDDNAHLTDPRLKKLVKFHNATSHYECKGILRSHFDRIVLDYQLPHLVVDFGVYSDSYVYKALTNQSDVIVGSYSRDSSEVNLFSRCFDTCWNSGMSMSNDPSLNSVTSPTVEWLLT